MKQCELCHADIEDGAFFYAEKICLTCFIGLVTRGIHILRTQGVNLVTYKHDQTLLHLTDLFDFMLDVCIDRYTPRE